MGTPIYDPAYNGYRIFIGDIGEIITRHDLNREYDYFGTIIDLWIAK